MQVRCGDPSLTWPNEGEFPHPPAHNVSNDQQLMSPAKPISAFEQQLAALKKMRRVDVHVGAWRQVGTALSVA